MRVHNSYHISINCCNVSQFEAHIRSILNMEIPQPQMIKGEMHNIISNVQSYEKVIEELNYRKFPKNKIFYENYYKEPRGIRKIGHINVLDDDYSAISSIVGQEQTRFLSP